MAQKTNARVGIGPFTKVRQTDNPFDDTAPDMLAAMQNGYLEDAQVGGSVIVRPGTTRFQSITAARPQGFVRVRGGQSLNFVFIGGRIYRVPTDLSSALVDVTPTNVIVATTGFVYATQYGNASFVVNDERNIPWVATNLTATPITATPIPLRSAEVLLAPPGGGPDVVFTERYWYAYNGTLSTADGTAGVPLPAGTIPANQWGSYRVLLDPTNVFTPFSITAAAANYTTGYASEAAALAALPAVTAGRINAGYFTLQADGTGFTAGTENILASTTTRNFYAGDPFGWIAAGPPVIYSGSVFFILRKYPVPFTDIAIPNTPFIEGNAYSSIVWSEPALPLEGYIQTDFDNLWDLIQTSTDPIFALAATNDALYYFRQLSIGALAGAPGINFQGTATHDIVGENVGCINPATIAQFANYIFFADVRGRPWRFQVGGGLEPIWKQAQGIVEAWTITTSATKWWSVVEPNLNLWLLAYGTNEPTDFIVFDAITGTYNGTWNVAGTSDGVQAGGILTDSAGLPQLVLGNQQSTLIYLWKLARVQDGVWTDNGSNVSASFTSGILGYDALYTTQYPTVRAVVRYGSGTPSVNLSAQTTQTTLGSTAGTVLSSPVQSPNYRVTWQTGILQGRGIQLTLAPSATASQFRLFRIEVEATNAELAQVTDF